MLAISSAKYCLPVKLDSNGVVDWLLVPRKGEDRTMAKEFNYTLRVRFQEDEFSERFTAHYDGVSVKPVARTLRVFGSERCQRVVSFLSSIDDVEFGWKHSAPEILFA